MLKGRARGNGFVIKYFSHTINYIYFLNEIFPCPIRETVCFDAGNNVDLGEFVDVLVLNSPPR